MSRAVWKFPIPAPMEIPMPKGAKILTVASQFKTPTMWALVDPDADLEHRKFFIAGTGHPMPNAADEWTYLGTAHDVDGLGLVFHFFEDRT